MSMPRIRRATSSASCGRARELHAAGLAAAADEHLGLDHDASGAVAEEPLGRGSRLGRRAGDRPRRDGQALARRGAASRRLPGSSRATPVGGGRGARGGSGGPTARCRRRPWARGRWYRAGGPRRRAAGRADAPAAAPGRAEPRRRVQCGHRRGSRRRHRIGSRSPPAGSPGSDSPPAAAARAGQEASLPVRYLQYRGGEGMLAWAFHRISGVADLGVHPAPRPRHLAGRRQPGPLRRRAGALRQPDRAGRRDARRRGAPLPRPQRPADHRHGLLAVDDASSTSSSGTPAGSSSSSSASRAPTSSCSPIWTGAPDEHDHALRPGEPAGGGFELAVWYLIRLSGLALFVLALAHFSITHFVFDVTEPEGRSGSSTSGGAASSGGPSTG